MFWLLDLMPYESLDLFWLHILFIKQICNFLKADLFNVMVAVSLQLWENW